jgi:hypothetical protein
MFFTILGILVIRFFVSTDTLKSHHDVAGVVFCNLGVLYSVLLGFTVVNVQQRFDKVREILVAEGGCLVGLYRDAETFREPDRNEIRSSIKTYAKSVLEEEWPKMRQGIDASDESETMRGIWNAYYHTSPIGLKQSAWYKESLRRLNALSEIRALRHHHAVESLSAGMWSLLVLGGIIMVSFIWFFGVRSLLMHIIMGSVMAASVAFLLFLIYSLDTVYTGNYCVPPDPFIKVLDGFN